MWQATPKTKKAKEPAKAKPEEEKKEEVEVEKESTPAENGEAKDAEVCLFKLAT